MTLAEAISKHRFVYDTKRTQWLHGVFYDNHGQLWCIGSPYYDNGYNVSEFVADIYDLGSTTWEPLDSLPRKALDALHEWKYEE